MCGRFALAASPGDLIEEFAITVGYNGPSLPADWNVAPTRPIYIIKDNQANERELDVVSWGLIAPWAKDRVAAVKSQSQAINARTESVHEKPTFRSAFRSRRCLIPVTGYYEWATEFGPFDPKQPFYIHGANLKPLLLAGIYDRWVDANGEIFESAAIITREAEGSLAKIHHRMPTFLPDERWDAWLDPKLIDVDLVKGLLDFPETTSLLSIDPVSTRVNYVRNNDPELIAPIEIQEQQTLF
jgi:putative SOS response-associated peptidase YedK